MFFDFIFNNDEIIDYNFCINLQPHLYKKYLMKLFKEKMGYSFNLDSPKTLNELIQFLKIYDTTPEKEYLTDKTNIYNYVKDKLGNSSLIKEVYKVYDNINQINYDELPNKFMIKLNNSCRANFPVLNKQKINQELDLYIKTFFENNSKINYAFVNGFELQYKNIEPKIIVERLYPKISEIQVLCSYGKPILISYLDEKNYIYNKIYKIDEKENIIGDIPVKCSVKNLVDVSKELSKEFRLIRVDFMVVNGQYPFFQEFTFTPYSGFAEKQIIEFNSKEYSALCNKIVKDTNKIGK